MRTMLGTGCAISRPVRWPYILAMLAAADFPDLTPEALAVQPLARSETVPSSWYVDPRFHALDAESVLARSWQYVGHAERAANPGDYFLADVAGSPVIVIRGADGALRAFYNVCRHRAGPLATCDGHADKVLKCHYHGWTYRLDGMLRGVPSFDRVELFDKKDYGLVPVRLETWEGLVFVNLDTEAGPLAEVFGGIVERIAPNRVTGKRFSTRVVYDVRCNWKVYVDNYLEGYHVPIVHPELCKLYDYRSYVTETFEWYSLQYSPLSGEPNLYASGAGDAYYYWVYPNFMLNILPGRLQTNLVVPVAADQTRVVFDYYYDDIDSPQAREFIARDLAFSDDVQREDIDVCERVHRGLASRAYDRGRFSVKFEEGVWHFQALLKAAYGAWLRTPARRPPVREAFSAPRS